MALDPTGKQDSTAAIQQLVSRAEKSRIAWQPSPGAPYIANNPVVTIPPGKYRTTKPIIVGSSTILEGRGAIMLGEGTCFQFNPAWRVRVTGFTFVGYETCISAPTGNLNIAKIEVDHCTAQDCGTLLDTVGYDQSRSTLTTVEHCILIGARLKIFTDVAQISHCWFNHPGKDAAMILDSLASVTNCVGVPTGQDNARWIDFYSSEVGRSLAVRDCRFGGESGGITTVYNFARGNETFLASNSLQTTIVLDNVMSCPVGSAHKCSVLLFAMPNGITLRNVSGSEHRDGLVAVDSSLTDLGAPQYHSISIDRASRRIAAHGVPLLPKELMPYLEN